MAKNRYHDFDAAMAESGVGKITVHVCGRDWLLPVSPPARDMARANHAMQQAAKASLSIERGQMPEEVPDISLPQLAEWLAGDTAGAWLDAGITDDQLKAVVGWLWRSYNGVGEDAEKDPTLPGEEATTSSDTGESSRPTSLGSMASI